VNVLEAKLNRGTCAHLKTNTQFLLTRTTVAHL